MRTRTWTTFDALGPASCTVALLCMGSEVWVARCHAPQRYCAPQLLLCMGSEVWVSTAARRAHRFCMCGRGWRPRARSAAKAAQPFLGGTRAWQHQTAGGQARFGGLQCCSCRTPAAPAPPDDVQRLPVKTGLQQFSAYINPALRLLLTNLGCCRCRLYIVKNSKNGARIYALNKSTSSVVAPVPAFAIPGGTRSPVDLDVA